MTDRKPDVLPVEGASIESLSVDALVSLIEDRLDYYYPEAIEALGALKRRAAAQVAPPRPLDKERASVAEGLEALDYLTLHTNANGFADGACALATLRLELERAAAEGEAHAKLVDALQWLPPCELSFTDEEMFLEEVEAMGWRYEPLLAPPKGSTP